VLGPPDPELLIGDGQLAHKDREGWIGRVRSGFHAQDLDACAGHVLPLRVDLAHHRVGEDHTDVVALGLGHSREVTQQLRCQRIPREDVEPGAEDDGAGRAFVRGARPAPV
jgi:hypothetical protein